MKTLLTTISVLGAAMIMLAGPAAAKTWQQCDYEARQYANSYANPGGAAVGGALAGGLLGLGISSITGNTNTAGAIGLGAAAGAGTGLVVGSAKWKQFYDNYMSQCGFAGVQPQPVYAPQPVLGPAPGPSAGVYQSLNVRAGPGTNFAVIGVLQPGSVVSVNGCTPSWCQVGLPSGWGWVSRKYLYFG